MARLLADIPDSEHKYLKMCCAKIGMSLKDFIREAVIQKVDEWEDRWMLERWEEDGTRKEIDEWCNDPEKESFQMSFENEKYFFTPMKAGKAIGDAFEI